MNKIKYILLVATLVVAGAFANWYYGLDTDILSENANQSTNEKRARGEVFVYETEASGADECSSYEYFDDINKVCYFECESESECKQIEDSINRELDEWAGGDDAVSDEGSEKPIPSNDKSLVAEYNVTKGENIKLKIGKEGKLDKEVWLGVSNLSPNYLSDKYIDTFQVFDNAGDDTLAFVDDEDGDGKWRIGVNLAGYRSATEKERNLTVVHELGHIVTLNIDHINPVNNNCKTYNTDEGCSLAGSYLNQFVKNFWSQSDIAKSKKEDASLYSKNKFITEYASTNPEEDMAESFAYFVLSSKPTDLSSIKNKKLNFFYSFADLVKIRDDMRSGLSSNIIRTRKVAEANR
jgi:hypothetical protein